MLIGGVGGGGRSLRGTGTGKDPGNCPWTLSGAGDRPRPVSSHKLGRLRDLSDLFHLLLDHLAHFSHFFVGKRLRLHPIVHFRHPSLHLLLIFFHLTSHDGGGSVGLASTPIFFRFLLVDALLHLPTPRLVVQPVLPFRLFFVQRRVFRKSAGCSAYVVVVIRFVVNKVMPEGEGA